MNTPFKKRKVNQSALLKENTGSVPENLQPDTTNSGSVPCPIPVPSQPTLSSGTKEPDTTNSGSVSCPTPVPSQPTLSSGTKKKVPTGSTCTNDDAKVPRLNSIRQY